MTILNTEIENFEIEETEIEETEIEDIENENIISSVSIVPNNITVYFRPEKDYLHITGNDTYPSPDIERTLSENGYAIVDNQLTLPQDFATMLMINHLIDDNFMLQKCWFVGTSLQALMLLSFFVPKMLNFARRTANRSKSQVRRNK